MADAANGRAGYGLALTGELLASGSNEYTRKSDGTKFVRHWCEIFDGRSVVRVSFFDADEREHYVGSVAAGQRVSIPVRVTGSKRADGSAGAVYIDAVKPA